MQPLTLLAAMTGAALAGCSAAAIKPSAHGSTETADTSDWTESAPWDDACDALAETAEAERVSLGAPAAAFAVVSDSTVLCATGLGTSDVAGRQAADAETLFRIGGLTEVFSAVAALQQVGEARLDLDGTLPTYVADFAGGFGTGDADTVTVGALLDQTAALTDISALDADPRDEELADFLLHTYAPSHWLNTTSGALWNPSVPNTAAVGLLTERAEGLYYRQAIQSRLFKPLSLDRTFFLGDEVRDAGNAAEGLAADWSGATDGEVVVVPTAYDNGWARPADYAWSSAWDLGRLAAFLLAGNADVLSDDLREAMETAQVDTGLYLDQVGYGYGLYVDQGFALPDGSWEATPLLTQSGDIPGYSADLVLLPASGVGIATLASADDAHLDTTLAEALQTFGALPDATASDPEIDPADFAAWEGTWIDGHTAGAIIIGVDGEDLTVDIPLFDEEGIAYETRPTPVAKGVFLWSLNGEDQILSFVDDADGNPAWLRTRPFVATPAAEEMAMVPEADPLLLPPPRPDPALRALRWMRAR